MVLALLAYLLSLPLYLVPPSVYLPVRSAWPFYCVAGSKNGSTRRFRVSHKQLATRIVLVVPWVVPPIS